MLALTHFVLGLAIAHLTLLAFFLIGSAAFPWCDARAASAGASQTMMRVVCTCGLGMAIAGLVLFALGCVGALSAPGISVALVLTFVIECAVWRISPLRRAFWQARGRALVESWSWPAAAIYAAMLVIATRAVIPEGTGYSDAIYYHLAYAQDWANAGRLVVDPFMAFIFYANNFVLLFAGWMVLGAGAFVQFLTWSTGLLAALGVFSAITAYGRPEDKRWVVPIALLAVLALIASPIFIDYAVLGYIDVPIGAMTLLSVIALQVALRERGVGWLVTSAVIAGFLIGMKASFLVLLPIFGIALFWAATASGFRRTTVAWVLAVLCAVAAPWYVRNWILAGDPIAPTLNIALHGHDGLWKASEWDYLWNDMATSKSPRALATLPIRAYLHPTAKDFREYGASGLILFLYVPGILVVAALLMRRRIAGDDAVIPIFVLSALVLYWIASTSLLRYALLFYPLLALCVAMLLVRLVEWQRRWAAIALLMALVAALPTFSTWRADNDFIQNDLLSDAHAFLHYRGEQAFLDENDDGYADEQLAALWMNRHGYSGNVYVISDNAFDYYFRRNGVTSIGNWIGPAGYFRLLQAIDAQEAAEFLDGLGTRAVFFSRQQLLDSNIDRLLAIQLQRAGYRQVPLTPGSAYHLYVRG